MSVGKYDLGSYVNDFEGTENPRVPSSILGLGTSQISIRLKNP